MPNAYSSASIASTRRAHGRTAVRASVSRLSAGPSRPTAAPCRFEVSTGVAARSRFGFLQTHPRRIRPARGEETSANAKILSDRIARGIPLPSIWARLRWPPLQLTFDARASFHPSATWLMAEAYRDEPPQTVHGLGLCRAARPPGVIDHMHSQSPARSRFRRYHLEPDDIDSQVCRSAC